MQVLTVDYTSDHAPELFCQSLKDTGFGVLTNHPIPKDLIDLTYQQWKNFSASETSLIIFWRPSAFRLW